ncbi:MAG: tryptophan-rich sensory protein [Clostridia bacterium]|nr:tryptophan-rich sensory protein [Clostridia bacterium]
MKEKVKSYVVSILIALTAGGLSAILTMGNMDIYNTLKTPPLSPPSILFPIVWTVLYIVMGVSAAMIYNTAKASHIDKSSALFTYAISLIFNFLWSIIFFNMRSFLLAFIWLLILLFLIVRTIIKYYNINPTAAYLQIPYLLWVCFAGYLNFAIWYLNR